MSTLHPTRPARWWLPAVALFFACLCALLWSRPALAQNSSCGEPQRTQGTVMLERCVIRTFNLNAQEKKVVVYYTTTNGAAADRLRAVDGDGNAANGNERSADALAAQIADWTVDAWRIYSFYNFPDPLGGSYMSVHIFDIVNGGLIGWCCDGPTRQYQVEAATVVGGLTFGGDTRDVEAVVYHEMWHAVRYNGGFGDWVNEGTASFMTDHVDESIDNDATNDYMGRVWAYMNGEYRTPLRDTSYRAALWWTYATERTSGGNNTVQRGVDAMKAFWDGSASTDFVRLDNMIRARAPGQTFESIWIDFSVANFAKDLAGGVQPKYRYFDETHSLAPDYPAPAFAPVVITPSTGVIPTLDGVEAWATQYYVFDPTVVTPFINIEVRQELNKRLAYTVLVIDNNNVVREVRRIGRDFEFSIANNSYDRVVLIVTGLGERANYRYSANTALAVNIVDPIFARTVQVGDPAAPDKLLIKLDVFAGPGGNPIPGIVPTSFAITVGTAAVQPADHIASAYIQGQYWLLVRAPVQAAPGFYNLTVAYAGVSDTENSSVQYVPRANIATMVVVDRSGSMNDFGKLQAAKDAARLYIDAWRAGDLIGVASFNENASVELNLADFATVRDTALGAINGLVGAGNTSIGDGAQAGMQNLIDRDTSTRPWSIMLLSDGIENEDIRIATFLANYNARRNAAPPQKVPRVNAVALGPDADRARMEQLADATRGVYYVAALPQVAASTVAGSSTAAAPQAIQAAFLSNDLAEIYLAGSEYLGGLEQVGVQTWAYDNDSFPQQFKFAIDGSAGEANFVIKWDSGVFPERSYLRKPNGTDIFPAPVQQDSLHRVYRVAAPDPGEWTVVLDFDNTTAAGDAAVGTAPDAAPDGLPLPDELLIEASVRSRLTLNAFLGLAVEQRLVGAPMPILASLADSAPIRGATVNAFVAAPAGFYSVPLRDDGLHGDGAAGDGFYGGTLLYTQAHGGYNVTVTATGSDTTGTPFSRRVRLGFNMLQSRFLTFDPNFPDYDPNYEVNFNDPFDPNRGRVDKDNDRLIDTWEKRMGLDPNNSIPNQEGDDPDYDGLSNGDEFMNGTDPLDSDTDDGGQNDGSEVTGGLNPLDPSDDQVACPYNFAASATRSTGDESVYTGQIWLTYEVHPGHVSFSLWRKEGNGTRDFVTDQLPATGIYSDTAVSVGNTYTYWLSANSATGAASCILGPSSATLEPNAEPPQGIVRINGDASQTASPNVTLAIQYSSDAVEMQVRHRVLDFDDAAAWEPVSGAKPWTLTAVNGMGAVHVRFRDAAGNISDPATDLIEIVGPAGGNSRLYLPTVFGRR